MTLHRLRSADDDDDEEAPRDSDPASGRPEFPAMSPRLSASPRGRVARIVSPLRYSRNVEMWLDRDETWFLTFSILLWKKLLVYCCFKNLNELNIEELKIDRVFSHRFDSILLWIIHRSEVIWNRRTSKSQKRAVSSGVSTLCHPSQLDPSPPPSVDSWHRFDSASRSAIVRTRASVLPRHCYLDHASSSPFLSTFAVPSLEKSPLPSPRFIASFPCQASRITNVFNILFSFVTNKQRCHLRVSINYPSIL